MAAAKGFVSRIKVSAYGYGNALYITHPNGHMTVYGHLDRYMPRIQEYVMKEHYRLQSLNWIFIRHPINFQWKPLKSSLTWVIPAAAQGHTFILKYETQALEKALNPFGLRYRYERRNSAKIIQH